MDSKSISLWEANRKIREALEAIEGAEELGHGSMIDAFVGDILSELKNAEGGVDRCVGFVKFTEMENEAIEQEIGRLLALKKRNNRAIDRVKGLAHSLMTTLGMDQLPGKFGRSFSLRSSSSVDVVALDKVPEALVRVTTVVEPNKAEILRLLRAGEKVSGCELKIKESVVVK